MSRPRRTASIAAGLLTLMAGRIPVMADPPPPPRVWMFNMPEPEMGFSPRDASIYQRMVKVYSINESTEESWDGSDAAYDLAAKLSENGAYEEVTDHLCVVLLGFGRGNIPLRAVHEGWEETWQAAAPTFLFSADDALNDSDPPGGLVGAGITNPQGDIWPDAGADQAKDWVEDFAFWFNFWAGYLSLPVPERFAFDNELPFPWANEGGVEGMKIVQWMFGPNEETRRENTLIFGFDNKTLDDLWSEKGFEFDLEEGLEAENYIDFANWYYNQIGPQIDEGAMKYSVYDPIHAVWEECLCSDYDRSMRTDGGASGWRIIQPRYVNNGLVKPYWDAFADQQAAVLYPITRAYAAAPWSCTNQDEATLEHHRRTLDACVRSFPLDGPARPITPWITVPCFALNDSGAIAPYKYNEATMRRLLALMKSRGVNEMNVWTGNKQGSEFLSKYVSNASIASWNAFDKVLWDVYGSYITDVTVSLGTPATSPTDELTYAMGDGDELEVDMYDGGVSHATVDVEFSTTFNTPSPATNLEVNTEMWWTDCVGCDQNTTTDVEVFIWDYDLDDWVMLDSYPLASSDPNHPYVHTSIDSAAGDHVDESGNIKIQLHVYSTAHKTIHFDLVQVVKVEADACTCCCIDCEDPCEDIEDQTSWPEE